IIARSCMKIKCFFKNIQKEYEYIHNMHAYLQDTQSILYIFLSALRSTVSERAAPYNGRCHHKGKKGVRKGEFNEFSAG
ncbi:MAG: hypothetical protein IIY16_07425, partial [Oscillospiraceae bacterium]|nr:hypothetical protein [Oscillospiraceae bacterium]